MILKMLRDALDLIVFAGVIALVAWALSAAGCGRTP